MEKQDSSVVDDPDHDVVRVNFSVDVKLPKDASWTPEQKTQVAQYMALYTTRCAGEFQRFKWGCGAFMAQTFQDPDDDPEEIRARVVALDPELKISVDDYTKTSFIETFGQETFNNLKKGWPRKYAAVMFEQLIDFSKQNTPKIVELL